MEQAINFATNSNQFSAGVGKRAARAVHRRPLNHGKATLNIHALFKATSRLSME